MLITLISGNDIITEEDRDNIRAFKLKMTSTMSRSTFNKMRQAFAHKMTLNSEYRILHRIAVLSGVKPVEYDCCIKSCIAYTEKYEFYERCPFCQEPRYDTQRRPRRIFSYLPVIPRLQAFFQSPKTIEKLSYRFNYVFSDDRIRDVFDGEHYQTLLQQYVEIDGVKRAYKHFSGAHDIALALCTDGHLIFRHRRSGPAATPILIQVYNLPPQIRTHLTNLICIGIIPDRPKDLGSFLAPFDEERVQLAYGIQTYNAIDCCHFDMRAYVIIGHGDLVAIAKMLGIKGHNGYSPCRSCKTKGVRDITEMGKTYYIPLRTPAIPHQTRPHADPRNLARRRHSDFHQVLQQIEAAVSEGAKKQIAIYHGIREAPAITRVKSINYARSIAWDWMHLFCENVFPNMFRLWSNRFGGLKNGNFDYVIPNETWQVIGLETAEAVKNIPAAFVRVLGNIAVDRSNFTAESWAFWFIYVAPIVLKNRFPHKKYYKHMCALANIAKMSLKYEITYEEIDELEEQIVSWVEKYEK
jgi:hypothetical protein